MQLTTAPFAIAPLPERFLHQVRALGRDDLGQPVRRLVAEGGEPCRDVLRRARPGERLILASFGPFAKEGPYREFGPVFVLAEDDGAEVVLDALPAAGGEGDYLRDRFVIRSYSEAEEIRGAEMVGAAGLEETVARLLADDATAFLHVRFPTYGCFALRIDRGRTARG